jgi:hypothetical protein
MTNWLSRPWRWACWLPRFERRLHDRRALPISRLPARGGRINRFALSLARVFGKGLPEGKGIGIWMHHMS